MRLYRNSVLGVSAAALMLSAAAARAQDGNVNVTTAADTAKLGGEFRSELNYDNNMLMKEDGGPTPKASTTLQVQTANIKLRGNLNKNTEYAFRFNLLNPSPATGGPLDYGYGTHWFTDMFGWSIGKMKVVQGGWDQLDGGFRDHAVGVYRKGGLPFNSYEAMTALHIKAAGKLSLQVLNDTGATSKTPAQWNKNAHPTYALGWQGDFGGLMPLVDAGAYDNQKSMWWDVGFKAKLAGVDASLDFGQNRHARKGADTAGKAEPWIDTATNVALRAGYEIKDTAKPWIYFSTYNVAQFDDSKLAQKDHKFNGKDPATGAYLWDDNGQTIGVGADILSLGKNWNPYLALVNQSGKWQDPAHTDAGKAHNDLQVRVGALGEF